MGSTNTGAVPSLTILSILLKMLVMRMISQNDNRESNNHQIKESTMNSINRKFSMFVSRVLVAIGETVWAVLTSVVAGICLLA